MAVRIEFTAPESLVESLDEVRGHEPRASFIKRALESALGDGERKLASPASTRMPASATDAYLHSVQKGYNNPRGAPYCPDCGKANGVHKGDCPSHPGRKR